MTLWRAGLFVDCVERPHLQYRLGAQVFADGNQQTCPFHLLQMCDSAGTLDEAALECRERADNGELRAYNMDPPIRRAEKEVIGASGERGDVRALRRNGKHWRVWRVAVGRAKDLKQRRSIVGLVSGLDGCRGEEVKGFPLYAGGSDGFCSFCGWIYRSQCHWRLV